ncbi:hypothetical protein H8356DRAFT_1325345 [Neocallimastix lanati (nom. inval.)]|nr:hypothetical protein H8356DRAFT_1325345 [Neocallimastix sp. JGI-2020a]
MNSKLPRKTFLEYLLNLNVLKHEDTIISGFKVLTPDFPIHGKTEGAESEWHCFDCSINALICYVNSPVYILAYSIGNAFVKRYVGIDIPNKFTDIFNIFENMIGISGRFDISKMVFDFNKAKISAALLSHKNYKVISKIKTYLFESEGLDIELHD